MRSVELTPALLHVILCVGIEVGDIYSRRKGDTCQVITVTSGARRSCANTFALMAYQKRRRSDIF